MGGKKEPDVIVSQARHPFLRKWVWVARLGIPVATFGLISTVEPPPSSLKS